MNKIFNPLFCSSAVLHLTLYAAVVFFKRRIQAAGMFTFRERKSVLFYSLFNNQQNYNTSIFIHISRNQFSVT